MLSKEDKEIINDLFTVYPEEGCGLLINKSSKQLQQILVLKTGTMIFELAVKRAPEPFTQFGK